MKSLKRSEKRLLLLCFLTVFMVANLFLLRGIVASVSGDKYELSRLAGELESDNVWIGDEEYWRGNGDWIDTNIPSLSNAGTAGSELLGFVQKAGEDRLFTIESQTLRDPRSTPHYQAVVADFKIRGELPKVLEWLTRLQQPDAFLSLRRLRIVKDTRAVSDVAVARCEFTLERWFRPEGNSSVTSPAPNRSVNNGPTGE